MAKFNLDEARTITAEIEKTHEIPAGTLFKIGGIESSFDSDAVSDKGARSYFQFMEPTAKAYGVKYGDFRSEADGAARYIKDNLKKYNGNMNMALADYNGGPKAAAALAKGKPWTETVDYLKKFNGGSYTPLSPQFTTGESTGKGFGPSAAGLAREAAVNADENGGFFTGVSNLPRAAATGFELDNTVYNFWKQRAVTSEAVDPNFQRSEEYTKEYLKGIPQEHWQYMLQGMSAKQDQMLRARMLESLEKEKELGKMGMAGTVGRIAGGLADIPTLIAFVPGAGGEGLLTATSRVSNAIRMGLVGGASNAAIEALTAGNRPNATIDDIYMAAAMGLGLGAVVGGSSSLGKIAQARLAAENKALESFGLKEGLKAQVEEFKRLDLDLTDTGKELYLKRISDYTKKASDEVMRDIEKQSEVIRKEFKFDPVNDNVRTETLIKEVQEAPPVFDRGRINTPDYGAEEKVKTMLFRTGADDKAYDFAAWTADNFTFTKDGKIKSVTFNGVTKDDLKVLGVVTKEDLERVIDKVRLDKNYQNLVRFAKQESGLSVMERLAQSADPRISSLAKRLREQFIDDIPVYTVRQKDIDLTFNHKKAGSFAGFYSSTRHGVFVAEGTGDGVMLHELLHAATVHKLDYGVANPNTIHGQLTKELEGLYQDAVREAKKQGFKSYYLGNVKEFTAGLYSGTGAKGFHDFLIGMKTTEGGNYLSKIVDVFRKLLGLNETDTNYLLKSLDLTNRLIDEKLTVKMDRGPKVGVDTIQFSPAHAGIPEETAMAATKAEIPPIFGWGLGLENRLGSAKIPQAVRDLASKLFGTTVGYKDHSVVKVNAWDDTTKWSGAWFNQMAKTAYPAFEDWFAKSGMNRLEKSKAYEDFGTQVSNYIRGMDGDYAPQVIKAGDSVRKTLANVVDYINNPLHEEGGSKKGLTMQEVRDPDTGVVTLVGGLDKNPNYLPRKHDVNKWNSLVQTHGRDAVEGWWARAHQAGREGVSDEQAKKFAKWYVRTVEEAHANRAQDLMDDLIRGQDKEALKQSLMINGGFSEFEAKKLMDDMFPTKESDTGRTMSSLKHRNTIDEKYTEKWKMADGTMVDVNINNFVHSNVFDVVNPYLRRTAGSVAMAKHLDVYKVGDIDKAIADATENKLGGEFKSRADVDKMRKDLQFAFDRIQGLPQEEFSALNKSASMWHSFNVIRLMGGAVWNQATELGQIVGSMGYKATMEAASELKALQRDIATGKAPAEILDHLENTIGGAGSDFISRMDFGAKDDWVRNLGDTKMNQWLDKIDTGLNKTAKGVLDYTGMTPLMIQQKRIHAIALVNHFVNQANGKISSTFLTKERLAWMGLDEAASARLMDNLKKYSKENQGEFSKSHKLDVATWVKEDPESHSAFMNAIHRESRRVIQENDLGSMIPLMGTTLGKTVFQFMNFSMHGWNKSLMFAANHKDWTTMSTVLHGSMLASMAYMGRTMLGSMGQDEAKRQEYLDKRMAPSQIIANSFGRIAQASMLPNIYDTLSPYPVFNGMRTTSDLSSLASNPTYQAINGVLSLKKIVRNGTSDEYQTTSKDVQAWGKLLPLNNVFPMSTLLNSIANDYPTTEKER